MKNGIAQEFNTLGLIKFALPSMIMMVFMSLYTIVDGIFISRLVGDAALSAANIVYPAISVLFAVGIMLSTGGSAVTATKLGEGKEEKARESFTFIIFMGVLFAVVMMIGGNLFLTPLVRLMGATDRILEDCRHYLGIMLLFAPACVLQIFFQCFFVTAGKPNLGLGTTVAGGIANGILDYLFMGPMHMGISGAALATGIGQVIPAVIGCVYFFTQKKDLYFVKFHFMGNVLKQSCLNGSSEMVTNLATAVVTYLFNIIMLKLLGEEGVAAIAIISYGQFVFNALFMGYSMGVAPVVSYNYGSGNQKRLMRIFKICLCFISVASVGMTVLAVLGGPFVVGVFTPPGSSTYNIGVRGFFLFAFNFLFAGINIFSSALFTALSNGKVSALLSFLRTFGFLAGCILILPYFLSVDGVWLSVPLAEFLTVFLSSYFLYRFAACERKA